MANSSSFNNSTAFVEIASSVAKLRSISRTTRDMSLSAINAKIITAHAGAKGRTFSPLTDFISILCNNIDNLAEEMSKEALALSRLSIIEMRMDLDKKRIERAQILNADAHKFLSYANAHTQARSEKFKSQRKIHLRKITELCQGIETQHKQAIYLNINCRIEATNVPAEREKFNAVAEHMMGSMNLIDETVKKFKEIL